MKENDIDIIAWLLSGDVSIQYQVHRDLLGSEQKLLRDRISKEDWGAAFRSFRKSNGHLKDGGFNCHFNRKGAVHSSLHSTISVIEGIA
jgi:hypothetical protein